MSSTTLAPRTSPFAPPAPPTRKAVPRRTSSRGAAVLGGAGRPLLRIVAEDESAPVVTRVGRGRGVDEPCEAPLRQVALEEFFAAEYDGDDVAVEVCRPRPSSLRLTRRGRLAVFVVGLLAALGVGTVATSAVMADSGPTPTRVVQVQPGQTLWSIATSIAHGGDVRDTMAQLERLNHLDSAGLQVGQTLRVPK